MFNKFIRIIGGDPNRKTVEEYTEITQEINALEAQYEALSNEQLRNLTAEFRLRLAQDETLDDILPEAFAAVREASKRTLGLRHYDVQMIGGIALHRGTIAEMRTGEGKTLVATLPLYLNALTGRGAHLVTVNDYLARRDARWMAPIYQQLGMSVGVLQMAARTENGQKAFLVDLERESPHEDQHQLRMEPRALAYAADITYGTNSEFGFDYLRDNMTMRLDQRVQRGHYYAIVDEVDNVLIDEARTPLIISGPASDDTEWYVRMAQLVRQLRPEDYDVEEKDRTVTLTEIGEMHVEELLGLPLRDPERPEDVTPEQARLLGYLEQALRAQHLFKRNKEYLVQAGKIVIVDEFTGRLMPGRRWSDGLHQAVEAKEGVRVQSESVTYATITIQNYFRMYDKLAGMSGTALTEAEEFDKIYKLGVLPIPTNLEHEAERPESALVELEERDEYGYKYRYYARKNDPQKTPVFWRRKDYPDIVYRSEEAKFRAISQEILRYHSMGRPVLVGTTSVELSERLSSRLRAEPLQRLAQAILLRRVWMDTNKREEDGRQIPELQFLNAPLQDLNVADMRKMARELSVSLTPYDPGNLRYIREALDLGPENDERLVASLKAGIQHQVLNARKHDEEGLIIAGAGGFGAVTIATNMAGRGVDIRLGGELPDEVINQVRLLLRREDVAEKLNQNGLADIDHLAMSQWPRALDLVDPDELRSRAEAVDLFRNYVEMEERVRQLGGLHVIGSERHEARRIDNQLRGRAARQGDPGSSRFYLSMEDDLMRMFGGQQADGLMQRLKVDDAVPIEAGLVSRIVEQSQTRVEGSNFDVRKHLLEYDDVLNSQRAKIYAQRDLIFTKEDLSEDVTEMLRTEVLRRVPEALQDVDGPWKLLGWLDSIQPSINFDGNIFPSYSLNLLVDRLVEQRSTMNTSEGLRNALVRLAAEALDAERDHLLHSTQVLLDSAEERLEEQLKERQDTLETYIEGLDLGDEEGSQPRNPKEIVDELSGELRFPVRLNNEQMRLLRTDPEEALADVSDQLVVFQQEQTIKRLVGAVERRLEENLELNMTQAMLQDWNALAEALFQAVEQSLQRRRERLVGNGQPGGQIGRDLENWLARLQGSVSVQSLTNILVMMPQGSRQVFDKKTHKRITQRTTRLTYIYLAARMLEQMEQDGIAEDVLEHLEKAHTNIKRAWGASVWPRFAGVTWENLDDFMKERLGEILDESKLQILENNPLQSLDNEDILKVVEILGGRALTQVYRQLLLGVIGELWVEYLTQMEALRVSIGLEAYAQRDPLVQYKGRASELFANLLNSMRLGVVNRMFTFRPRDLPGEQVGLRQEDGLEAGDEAPLATEPEALPEGEEAYLDEAEDEEEVEVSQPGNAGNASRSKKRRRRRK